MIRHFALVLFTMLASCSEEDAQTPMPGDGSMHDGSVDGSDQDASDPSAPCNGRVDLCSRRFDEVVFATTHNSHAAQEYGYSVNANQKSGLQKQLADGVRGFLMDVYDQDGETLLCHGSCALGSTPHREALTQLVDFLERHPREVLAIIYEDHQTVQAIASDVEASGLSAYVHTHERGEPWLTLQQMIAAGERVLITAENGAPPPSWFHHVWDEAWDTPYQFRAQADFVCDLNRGSRDNALFLVNHWLSGGLGSIYLPSEDGAKMVNVYDVLYARAKGCWDETGDKPNFLAVDFYEHGDLFRVVDALNDLP